MKNIEQQTPRTVRTISISIGDEGYSADFSEPIPVSLAIQRARKILDMLVEDNQDT